MRGSSRGFAVAGALLLALGGGIGLERLRSGPAGRVALSWPWAPEAASADAEVALATLLERPEGPARTAIDSARESEPAPAVPPIPVPGEGLVIRVGLVSQGRQASLGGTAAWTCTRSDGGRLQMPAGGSRGLGPILAGRGSALCRSVPGGTLTVNGTAYAGELQLFAGDGGATIVNNLPLEDYIASVVGAEMPASWPEHALRAQAVAARSYALAHMARPATTLFHLGDTTRWQAYRGLASRHPRTRQAAADTEGMILSFRGGIVESLYAATDGISREAHGHLGASMSQHGARTLAERGLTYVQILGRYYQGASLARLNRSTGRES
ncbi:SpoIID/LytB domain-containing protein [Synechococcus sp. RSCCF101]|uniref:SpoIID/LytB domain-containing protein n=1 Tax=Synechococcus sp. RSCCF101 TaxID=2511069 RepID=UPI001246D6EC|nr:SpoIID/LytB domain-containing protein [Synechococcus sp. RSCCF101]QEY31733.1 SpoIID/LytB domain-containing protein [Synechococcus sp. RSCCF101]